MTITFKQLRKKLDEARKNPELNPKISAYEALLPYKDDPNIFISFSNGKIGIKPMAAYDTVHGIYFFKLKDSWKFYGIDKTKSLGSLPYGLLYDNIYIVKKKPNMTVLNLSTLDNATYQSYCDKLLDVLTKDKNFNNGKSHEAYNALHKKIVQYGSDRPLPEYGDPINLDLMNFSKIDHNSIEYNKVIAELKKLANVYHYDFNIVDALKVQMDHLKLSSKSYGYKFYELTRRVVYFDFNPNDVSFITTKTNFIGFIKTFDHIKRWRQLFVDLGIDLVIDEGDSIIHFNEPCQAFFVDKSKFEVIDMIKNKEYKNYKDITDPEEALGYLNYKVDTKSVNLPLDILKYIKRNYLTLVVPVVNNINNKNEIIKIVDKHKEHHVNVQ